MTPLTTALRTAASLGHSSGRLLGGWALVVLGVHRAADRVDDTVVEWTALLTNGWGAEAFKEASVWLALGCEGALTVWLGWTLLRCRGRADRSLAAARDRACIGWMAALLCWGATATTGAWGVAMVVQDHLAPWSSDVGLVVGWTVGGLALLRLGLTSWLRLAWRAPVAASRLSGWLWSPLALGMTLLAIRHGLPVWGA